ncbi:MAG: phage tail tape measure protein, partial [Bacteroidota bacterium]|nr:phage tail tape measure protein [Bacteroidota bacterium]
MKELATTYTRRINLYINGKEVKNDIASIKGAMAKLINEQARMTLGSKEYYAHAAKIKQLKGIMQEHQRSLNDTQKSWMSLSKMADSFNKYQSLFLGFVGSLAGVVLSVKSAVNAYSMFEDKLADVMKTTGLTKDQVVKLNDELKKIDTRSSQEDLLNLARVAGKLGITAENDILGFVRAADQIRVALTEDLGGDVEDSINQLGKLVDIFKLKDQFGIEQSLLKVGSAINSLGAAGTANEGYMVEFSKRVAGIAPGAGISIQNILGLGATLDELGQTAEVSGTVFSQVISKMFTDVPTYAKLAGMSVDDFNKILSQDANEAFIKVLEGAKSSGQGFGDMAASFQELGLDGTRATAVLGVLADNITKLREKQALSNKEFASGISLTNEFNVKNNTAQAELEKAKKKFAELAVELGKKLTPAYTAVISKARLMVEIISGLTDFFIKHGRAILIAITSIVAYTAATKIMVLW